jgi:hypothetical protein
MCKRAVVLVTIMCCILSFAVAQGQEIPWQQISREHLDVTALALEPANPATIYIAAENSVFKTEDGGVSWRNILSIRGQNRAINFLCLSSGKENSLYAATGSGLYYSQDCGENWQRIFRGRNSRENDCAAVTVLPNAIYLGTKAGLFISKDNGRSWSKAGARLGENQIFGLAHHFEEPDYLYVACVDGVFKSRDAGKSWERVFVALRTEESPEEEQDENGENNHEAQTSQVKYIALDQNNPSVLYLATSRGVYKSQDRASTWELLSTSGLLSLDMRLVLITQRSRVLVATKTGVYAFGGAHWQELSIRLPVEEVNFLAVDNQENLYAACDKGLFKAQFENPLADKQGILALYCKDEPKINQVQKAAIRYAEVEPEKIKDWRRKAQIKAILPRLTVGIDRSESTNYEIYTSATKHYVYAGPYDKDNGWDVTLTWELGDLIWNDDQTSIDVRSRLMVELRDDILDEVNKLYFERIRLKMEIDRLAIEDRAKRLEKELRLEELTASLDALTGGYYSQCLKLE